MPRPVLISKGQLGASFTFLGPLLPRVIFPDFTWPQRKPATLASAIPKIPKPTSRFVGRCWGLVHRRLLEFSYCYCPWIGVPFDNQIVPLPFGLLLKWSDGTRLEEVLAMHVARAAGFPVPKFLCYGEHPDKTHAPVSILMTRLPGQCLGEVYVEMTDEERKQILSELKCYLDCMRKWSNPWGPHRICSISNGPIRSVRVPQHIIGPYDDLQKFNEKLVSAVWDGGWKDRSGYEKALACAKKLHENLYRIEFTHGDLAHHNILVEDGHVTGFIDWEAAGWYPDYWEFTIAWRYQKRGCWWWQSVYDLGGEIFLEEFESEKALGRLTSTSYAYW